MKTGTFALYGSIFIILIFLILVVWFIENKDLCSNSLNDCIVSFVYMFLV